MLNTETSPVVLTINFEAIFNDDRPKFNNRWDEITFTFKNELDCIRRSYTSLF